MGISLDSYSRKATELRNAKTIGQAQAAADDLAAMDLASRVGGGKPPPVEPTKPPPVAKDVSELFADHVSYTEPDTDDD